MLQCGGIGVLYGKHHSIRQHKRRRKREPIVAGEGGRRHCI